jgi:hypothetical protein
MTELLAGPAQFLAKMIDNSLILYGIMGAIGGVIMTKMVLGVIEMGKGLIMAIPRLATILGLETGIAAAKISGAMAATVGLGAIAILGGIAVGIGAMMSSVSKAKSVGDMSSPASGKTQVSTKEGGIFELSRNDDFAAAPGLIEKLNTPSSPIIVNQPASPIIVNQPAPPVQQNSINEDKIGKAVAAALAINPIQALAYYDLNEQSRLQQKAPLAMVKRKL